jgi:hypothetical protein
LQAFKFGYGQRTTLADPAFNKEMENITEEMIRFGLAPLYN